MLLILLLLLLLSDGFPVVHLPEVFARNRSLGMWCHRLRRHCFNSLFFANLFPLQLSQPYVRLVLFLAAMGCCCLRAPCWMFVQPDGRVLGRMIHA